MLAASLWQTATLVFIMAPTVYAHNPKEGYVVIEKHGTIWDIDENCVGAREWCGDFKADGESCDVMGQPHLIAGGLQPCTTSNCKYGVRGTLNGTLVKLELCLDAYCGDRCIDWEWECDTCSCGLFGPFAGHEYTNRWSNGIDYVEPDMFKCSAFYKVTCNHVCGAISSHTLCLTLQFLVPLILMRFLSWS